MATIMNTQLLEDMNRYLKGEMTSIELSKFENRLVKDAELLDELGLEIELVEVVGDTSDNNILKTKLNDDVINKLKQKLQSKEFQQLSNSIKNVEKEYHSETKAVPKIAFPKYYAVAAALLVLFVSVYLIQQGTSLSSYYDTHVNWTELQSFAEKSDSDDLFTKGELAFKNSNYKEAISHFNEISNTDELYPFSLLYLGACYDKINANDKAIGTFKVLTSVSSSQSTKGYWYKSLLYLKINDRDNAIQALKNVTADSSNFKFNEATLLLEKINN